MTPTRTRGSRHSPRRARRDELEALLKIAGAGSLAGDSASGDDAEASKPDPDIVHAALEKAGVAAGEAVMIGDTPYDVEAASRAGVVTIAFRSQIPTPNSQD